MDQFNKLFTDFQAWLNQLQPEHLAWQLAVILIAAAGAVFINGLLRRITPTDTAGARKLTLHGLQRLAFPLSMLALNLLGRELLKAVEIPVALLDITVPLLVSLAVIRFTVYMVRKAFVPTPAVKAWEQIISTLIWIVVALHLVGWLTPLLEAMDALAFQLGSVRVSLLSVTKLVLVVGLLLLVALWLSRFIESRLIKAQHLSPGAKAGIGKFSKFFLITAAVLLSLDAVGIDLTALTVFGGALGVGLGFGLQRIASNFISGFILIMDRSIKPGDVITIGQSFGWVEELRARYVVVRNREGIQSLIPNENLITTEVINWSYTDRNVRLKLPISISYGDDPEQALAIMLEAAKASSRVLEDPPPASRLMEFGDNGILLELRIWITDPENGVANVRSDVNIAMWRGFKEAGITIPFPQRDLHLHTVPAGLLGTTASDGS